MSESAKVKLNYDKTTGKFEMTILKDISKIEAFELKFHLNNNKKIKINPTEINDEDIFTQFPRDVSDNTQRIILKFNTKDNYPDDGIIFRVLENHINNIKYIELFVPIEVEDGNTIQMNEIEFTGDIVEKDGTYTPAEKAIPEINKEDYMVIYIFNITKDNELQAREYIPIELDRNSKEDEKKKEILEASFENIENIVKNKLKIENIENEINELEIKYVNVNGPDAIMGLIDKPTKGDIEGNFFYEKIPLLVLKKIKINIFKNDIEVDPLFLTINELKDGLNNPDFFSDIIKNSKNGTNYKYIFDKIEYTDYESFIKQIINEFNNLSEKKELEKEDFKNIYSRSKDGQLKIYFNKEEEPTPAPALAPEEKINLTLNYNSKVETIEFDLSQSYEELITEIKQKFSINNSDDINVKENNIPITNENYKQTLKGLSKATLYIIFEEKHEKEETKEEKIINLTLEYEDEDYTKQKKTIEFDLSKTYEELLTQIKNKFNIGISDDINVEKNDISIKKKNYEGTLENGDTLIITKEHVYQRPPDQGEDEGQDEKIYEAKPAQSHNGPPVPERNLQQQQQQPHPTSYPVNHFGEKTSKNHDLLNRYNHEKVPKLKVLYDIPPGDFKDDVDKIKDAFTRNELTLKEIGSADNIFSIQVESKIIGYNDIAKKYGKIVVQIQGGFQNYIYQIKHIEGNDDKIFELLFKKQGLVATAQYDFEAGLEGELRFKEHDQITLIARVDDNWLKGKIANGQSGIFPIKYVELDPGVLASLPTPLT